MEEFNFSRLKNFSISFLSIPLGLIGFTLTYVKAEQILKIPFKLSNYLLYFTLLVSVIIFSLYVWKLIRLPNEVKKEFNHPIKLNFFPIFAKVFLISSIILLETNLLLSKYFWWIGVILQSGFTLIILSVWIKHNKFEVHHINPSWFIPIVGTIIIPIAGIKHFSPELSWFFFSAGIVWWLILLVIVINRMIFNHPIPDKLVPTLFILFAPPAIGFISYFKLIGEITPFAKMLYYFSLFMFVLVLCQIRMFTRIRFYLSWWAYSFPLVALTVATLLMYLKTQLLFFSVLSWILFASLHIIIILLIFKTIITISRKGICVEDD